VSYRLSIEREVSKRDLGLEVLTEHDGTWAARASQSTALERVVRRVRRSRVGSCMMGQILFLGAKGSCVLW